MRHCIRCGKPGPRCVVANGCVHATCRTLSERRDAYANRRRVPKDKLAPLAERFWSKVDRRSESECWPWTATNKGPDGRGRLKVDGQSKFAPRVAWELTNGRIPPGLFVCHSCDNPPCCNPAHFWLGTRADNVRDMVEKDRANKWNGRRAGEANPHAKLTAEIVAEIRSLKGTASQHALARRFNISQTSIARINNRKGWKHVD